MKTKLGDGCKDCSCPDCGSHQYQEAVDGLTESALRMFAETHKPPQAWYDREEQLS